jgi:DNA-binding HxlR family transcriptional regulator
MAGLRSYGDPCGIARALDLIGERWALLIVRELLFGPKRFSELRAGLHGASPNVLAQRLRELERGGIVRRSEMPSPRYELSELGRGLHPVLIQLGQWGARSSAPARGQLSVDALLVALEATFKKAAAGTLRAGYELSLSGERYAVLIENGQITIARGALLAPDVVIETDASTLRAVVFGDQKLASANVQISGDKKLARSFFRSFERPALQR